MSWFDYFIIVLCILVVLVISLILFVISYIKSILFVNYLRSIEKKVTDLSLLNI